MPKGNGIISSGGTVHIRHIYCPCGKKYSGPKKKVDMLVRMHRKKCAECKEGEKVKFSVKTNLSVDNYKIIANMADSVQGEL